MITVYFTRGGESGHQKFPNYRQANEFRLQCMMSGFSTRLIWDSEKAPINLNKVPNHAKQKKA